jgi:hypothetical protein
VAARTRHAYVEMCATHGVAFVQDPIQRGLGSRAPTLWPSNWTLAARRASALSIADAAGTATARFRALLGTTQERPERIQFSEWKVPQLEAGRPYRSRSRINNFRRRSRRWLSDREEAADRGTVRRPACGKILQ